MTFYFYDLETSGINPRTDRIMQFGGQRTDMNLKPIGEPDNFLVKLPDDILPQPDAILTHGISPQKSRAEGITEREFLHFFIDKIAASDTIFVGYNNIRFDDEFIRFGLWRNFFDAYEWQWKEARSRWDLLDTARMTRALRPKGVEWPFAPDGKPSVRLELLAAINKLDHDDVHDALSDVNASIAVAKLIRLKQPKLFDYLLSLRSKVKAEALVNSGEPVVYTSGRYPSEFEKTTVAIMTGPRASQPGALMFDLRIDPDDFTDLEPSDLARLWADRSKEAPYFPVKVLSYNRSPAVAPLSVLDRQSAKRLKLDLKIINANAKKLKAAKGFNERLNKALEIIRPPRQPRLVVSEDEADELLYEGFINGPDKTRMSALRAATADSITGMELDFDDERLKPLFFLYKARNFPKQLTSEEASAWETFRVRKLLSGGPTSQAARFFGRIEELMEKSHTSPEQKYLLEELAIYGESILPVA